MLEKVGEKTSSKEHISFKPIAVLRYYVEEAGVASIQFVDLSGCISTYLSTRQTMSAARTLIARYCATARIPLQLVGREPNNRSGERCESCHTLPSLSLASLAVIVVKG